MKQTQWRVLRSPYANFSCKLVASVYRRRRRAPIAQPEARRRDAADTNPIGRSSSRSPNRRRSIANRPDRGHRASAPSDRSISHLAPSTSSRLRSTNSCHSKPAISIRDIPPMSRLKRHFRHFRRRSAKGISHRPDRRCRRHRYRFHRHKSPPSLAGIQAPPMHRSTIHTPDQAHRSNHCHCYRSHRCTPQRHTSQLEYLRAYSLLHCSTDTNTTDLAHRSSRRHCYRSHRNTQIQHLCGAIHTDTSSIHRGTIPPLRQIPPPKYNGDRNTKRNRCFSASDDRRIQPIAHRVSPIRAM